MQTSPIVWRILRREVWYISREILLFFGDLACDVLGQAYWGV